MKSERNAKGNICAIRYCLFSIIKYRNEYSYYLRSIFSSNLGSQLIYKSKKKSILLNKYVLSFIGFLYQFIYPFSQLIKGVIVLILWYVEGLINFVNDSNWVQNVRFFNWVNILFIFVLSLIIIFI